MSTHWIQGAVGKPGALHQQLGIPQGQKIPQSTLQAASKKKGKLGARARLAMTLEHLNGGGSSPASGGSGLAKAMSR